MPSTSDGTATPRRADGRTLRTSVSGGLRPASDLDILAVIGRPTTRDERAALIERILPLSSRAEQGGRRRSVELTLVVQDHVRPWRYPPSLDLQDGEWWRGEFERGDLAPWQTPNADLALLLAMVLSAGRPLFGPRAEEVLDPSRARTSDERWQMPSRRSSTTWRATR